MNKQRILFVFTRTPLHVGAGASVGAIDQPILRERHTGFPIIPGSSLKGCFADHWQADLQEGKGERAKRFLRINTRKDEGTSNVVVDSQCDAAWLFGSNNDKVAFAGALQFSEARLLAFPVRSARGTFAWITCPLILRRAVRDGCLPASLTAEINRIADLKEDEVTFNAGHLDLNNQVVLEEYTFTRKHNLPDTVAGAFSSFLPVDPVWAEIDKRLVVVSDGMMSFFAKNACEVAQHVRIHDETGTAEQGGLFNQECVPSETLFYFILHAFKDRSPRRNGESRSATDAINAFQEVVTNTVLHQFGGDASTGLGHCTLHFKA